MWSFIHVDDAAQATVAAIQGSATGAFNVVDDDPAPVAEWLPALASALETPRPLRVPTFLARLIAGCLDGVPAEQGTRQVPEHDHHES